MPKPITRLAAGDPDSERAFETGAPGIPDEICEAGYFDDDRPEDEVVHLLDEGHIDQLTKDHAQLYLERVLPLMRVWAFEHERFDEEYKRRRAEWARADKGNDAAGPNALDGP